MLFQKEEFKSLLKKKALKRLFFERLRNMINDAVKRNKIKNITINFGYSYLVIAKSTMLNNEYTIIKETLFRDLERIK